LVLHAGMFSPGGTGFDIPGYVSYVSAKQPRPSYGVSTAARASTTCCARRSKTCWRGQS
jgi:hypothetical protein